MGVVDTLASRRALAVSFWKFSQRSRGGHFGSLLGLLPEELGGNLRIEHVDASRSVVSTTVPAWCVDACTGRVRLSSTIAMFDEISTYAGTVQWDQRRRAGVSIQLAGRELGPLDIGAGDRITVETRLQKIGRTIGFVGIEVRDGKGTPVVHGSHVKFQPMGAAFDLAFHPALQAITLPLADALVSRQRPRAFDMPATIEEAFPLQALPESATATATATDAEAAAAAAAAVAVAAIAARHEMLLERRHGNPLGSLHGGAASMLAAFNAELLLARLDAGADRRPVAIKTNLLQGIPTTGKRRAHIESAVQPTTEGHPTRHVATTITDERGGQAVHCETEFL